VTDRVILQKLSANLSPAQKITRLKRENRESRNRRFQRDLEKEHKKDEKDTVSFHRIKGDVVTEAGEDESGPLGKGVSRCSAKRNKGQEDMPLVGSVVDIHV